jgi:hypothetical protein
MAIQDLTDEEIMNISVPLSDNIIEGARSSNYEQFSRDFHSEFSQMLDVMEFDRQQSSMVNNYGQVCLDRKFIKCLRNDHCVMVLWAGRFDKLNGEILTGLNLREIDNEIKVVGIWHHH